MAQAKTAERVKYNETDRRSESAVLLWKILFAESARRKMPVVSLLTSGADVQINGRSLMPVEARNALVAWGGIRAADQVEPLVIQSRESLQDFSVELEIPRHDPERLAADFESLVRGFSGTEAELVEIQNFFGRPTPVVRGKGGSIPQIAPSVLPVNVAEIARILNLSRGSFTVDRIAAGGSREGCLKVGRVYVTSIFPVVRPDSFAAPEQEWWRALGFESLEDWIRRDPLLIQIDTTGLENHIVVDFYEVFNKEMAHAVRSMVSVLSSAQVNGYLGRVLEGRSSDFSSLWENQKQDLRRCLGVLYNGAVLIKSRLFGLIDHEALLNEYGRVGLYPQEMATIGAAMRSLFWKMEVVADGTQMSRHSGSDSELTRVLSQFRADMRSLAR